MISDYCSRRPSNQLTSDCTAYNYVKFIANSATPGALTLKDVANLTQKDCILSCVMRAIETNSWRNKYVVAMKFIAQKVSDELSVVALDKAIFCYAEQYFVFPTR